MPPASRKPSPSEPDLPPSITTPARAAQAMPAVIAPPPDPALIARRATVAMQDGMVRALLAERAQLTQAGKTTRVDQVDEQLRLRGYPTE